MAISLFVHSQTPRTFDLKSSGHIANTNFTRNQLHPSRKGICNAPSGTMGPSWGGAIFMGSARSINPNGANFTLEKGRLSCILKTVVFEQNIADNGGAIAFVRASLLQMDDVQFFANSGKDGGAVFLELDGDPHPQVDFDPIHYVNGGQLLFQENVAEMGGALYTHVRCGIGLELVSISPYTISRVTPNMTANNEDAVFIENTKFVQNSAAESGGAWHVENGRVGCLSCHFLSNSAGASGNGGAIAIKTQAALHARNVTLIQNTAKDGGAIHVIDSIVDIVESNFNANLAEQDGGGMYFRVSGDMYFRLDSVGIIENSTFEGNEAIVGGRYMPVYCHVHNARVYCKQHSHMSLIR